MADDYRDIAQRALVTRELFSYRFPATGLKNEIEKLLPDFDQTVHVCRYLAEVAQLYSECLEKAFSKLGRPSGEFSDTPLRRVFEYQHKVLSNPEIIGLLPVFQQFVQNSAYCFPQNSRHKTI
jgi:hypothetical protein